MVDNIREAARNSALDTKIKSLQNFILSEEGQFPNQAGQLTLSQNGQTSSEEGQVSNVGERADDF